MSTYGNGPELTIRFYFGENWSDQNIEISDIGDYIDYEDIEDMQGLTELDPDSGIGIADSVQLVGTIGYHGLDEDLGDTTDIETLIYIGRQINELITNWDEDIIPVVAEYWLEIVQGEPANINAMSISEEMVIAANDREAFAREYLENWFECDSTLYNEIESFINWDEYFEYIESEATLTIVEGDYYVVGFTA